MLPRARCVPIEELVLASVAVYSGRCLRRDEIVCAAYLPTVYLRCVDGGAVNADYSLRGRVRRHRDLFHVRVARGDCGRRGRVLRYVVGGYVFAVGGHGVRDRIHGDLCDAGRRPVNELSYRVESGQLVRAARRPAEELRVAGERCAVDLYVTKGRRRTRHEHIISLQEEGGVDGRGGGHGDRMISVSVVRPALKP